jgi:adenosine kinase
MSHILVSGSVAYDTIIHVAEAFEDNILPEKVASLSTGFYSHHTVKSAGGTAHNISYNLGLLWHKEVTVMLASVGHDFVLDRDLSEYISYDHLLVDTDRLTAGAYILTDKNKHQITVFHPGAMQLADIQKVPENDFTYAVISPNSKGAMFAHAEQAKVLGAQVFFDPGQAMSLFTSDDIVHMAKYSDVLIVNDYEYSLLDKLVSTDLLALFPMIFVTKGSDGVEMLTGDVELHVHSCKDIVAVDPTGAGDAFRAWLLSGLMHGFDWDDAMRLGNVMGSFVVEREGTLGHVISLEQIEERFEKNYGKGILL